MAGSLRLAGYAKHGSILRGKPEVLANVYLMESDEFFFRQPVFGTAARFCG
jgi:hypothetical protein